MTSHDEMRRRIDSLPTIEDISALMPSDDGPKALPMRLSFVGRDGAPIREFIVEPGAELLIDDGIDRWMPSVYRVWLRR